MAEPGTASRRRAGLLAILNCWGPAVAIVVAIVGGYWGLGVMVLDGIKENVAALRADAGLRFDSREAEDQDIRAVIQSTNDALRADMGKLGDRIVQANLEVGARIDKMRDDLVRTMREGDDRLEAPLR